MVHAPSSYGWTWAVGRAGGCNDGGVGDIDGNDGSGGDGVGKVITMKLIIVFVVVSVILMVVVVVVTCSDISGDAASKGCYNETDGGGKIVMVVLMVKVMMV